MPHKPGERIFGVETEFGCLVADESLGSSEAVVELIKDQIFFEMKLGAIDLHSRDDVFEPAGSGGFLMNGARLYIDAVGSHLEYATAECRTLKDLVANDRAGQRQIVRAIQELGLSDEVSIYNNSVDHFGGHTFGCHENYQVRADDDFLNTTVHLFYPFLATRQIFAGVGRVGGHILTADGIRPNYQEVMDNPVDYIWVSHIYGVEPDDSVHFQLSQRADHIIKTIASRVRFNRALINPKWEHFYSHDGMTRLHLLFGESNQSEFAYMLKVGTTLLMLRLLEDGAIPDDWHLANPLGTLRDVSRDQSYRWIVRMGDGSTMPAVDLQRRYLELAQRYRGFDEQTDWTLDSWEADWSEIHWLWATGSIGSPSGESWSSTCPRRGAGGRMTLSTPSTSSITTSIPKSRCSMRCRRWVRPSGSSAIWTF
jgi:proteasome accessory factor A